VKKMSNISTIFWREAIKIFRSKSQLISSIIQPILWMVLYGVGMGSFIGGIGGSLGGVNYFSTLVPGIIILTVLFTSLFGGIGILFDKIFGLIKEISVSPISRRDIVIGKALGAQLRSLIQVALVFVGGFILGASFTYPYTAPIAFLGAIALIMLMGFGFIFISSIIAIKLSSFEGLNAILSFLTLPFFFTSGALFPIPSMPLPLQIISLINPATYALEGMKALFIPYNPAFALLAPEIMIPISFVVLSVFALVTLMATVYVINRTVLI
jgi:ABC-2 type transport system permease protein